MEKCPQCNTERQQDEQGQYLAFCDECGHKFAASAKPQTQSQSQSQSEPKSFEEYENEYVARATSGESAEMENNGESSEIEPILGGAICIPGSNDTDEQVIHIEDNPKTVGRSDVSALLKEQNKDPLQVSRKQFTIFKESDSYYIEDGKTSVQDNPSGNHTTVNGKDITGKGKVELNDGDIIGISTVLDVTVRIN